ncbi:MAG TPA: hypothetical protein VGE57_09135 [Solimonas sp.]
MSQDLTASAHALWMSDRTKYALLFLGLAILLVFCWVLFEPITNIGRVDDDGAAVPKLETKIWPEPLPAEKGEISRDAVAGYAIRMQVLKDLEAGRTDYVAEQANQAIYKSRVAHFQALQELELRSAYNDVQIRKSALYNQHAMKGPLLMVVVVIVFTGVALSVWQFAVAARTPLVAVPKATPDIGTPTPTVPGDTTPPSASGDSTPALPAVIELDISAATGLRLRTQVMGLAVLGMSLAFFYLFLIHVYTLQPEDLRVPVKPIIETEIVPGNGDEDEKPNPGSTQGDSGPAVPQG